MTELKISRKGWESSLDKWQKIREKTAQRIRFINDDGFDGLEVADPCAYCHEFIKRDIKQGVYSSENRCTKCPMNKKQNDGVQVCGLFRRFNKNSLFWQYVVEMQKHKPDFERALEIVDKIISAIEADKPPKKEDGG
ncbi:hypothetical protein ACFLZC_00095 [Patescibacteria group bacterium]